MKINKTQYSVIAKLKQQLEDKLGIKLGLWHWSGCFLDDYNDFIVVVEGLGKFDGNCYEKEEYSLFTYADVKIEIDGESISLKVNEKLEYEHLCAKFLVHLIRWLEDGTLTIEPRITQDKYSIRRIAGKGHETVFDVFVGQMRITICYEDIPHAFQEKEAKDILSL
jgi:hypothetical protein